MEVFLYRRKLVFLTGCKYHILMVQNAFLLGIFSSLSDRYSNTINYLYRINSLCCSWKANAPLWQECKILNLGGNHILKT